ncbi:hypothetical protein EV363DRAFT_1174736, partial [Boletus edulis]
AYGGDGDLTDADGPTDGGTQKKVQPESEDGGNRGAEKTKHVGPRNNDKGKARAYDMEDGMPNVGPSSKDKGKAHAHDMEDALRTDRPLSTRNTKTKHVGPSSKTKGKAIVHNTPNDVPRKDRPLSSSNTKKGMAQAEDLGYAGQPRPMWPTKQSKVKQSANTTLPERTKVNVTSAVTTSANAPFAMGSAKESTTCTLPNQERPNQPPLKSAALTSANNMPLMPLDTSQLNIISAEKTTDLLMNSADQRTWLIAKSTLMSKMQNNHLPRTSQKECNSDEKSNVGIGSDQRSRRGHIGKSANKDEVKPDAITPRHSGHAQYVPAPLDAEYDTLAITKKC